METREYRIIKRLAEDNNLSEDVVSDMVNSYIMAVDCGHICTSSCGNDTECNCDCGDMHIY